MKNEELEKKSKQILSEIINLLKKKNILFKEYKAYDCEDTIYFYKSNAIYVDDRGSITI